MLADAEEEYIEGWDKNDIVEANFGARRNNNFDAANALDETLGGPVAKGNERCRVHAWLHGIEEVASVDHVAVGPTVNHECGRTARAVAVYHGAGDGEAAVRRQDGRRMRKCGVCGR